MYAWSEMQTGEQIAIIAIICPVLLRIIDKIGKFICYKYRTKEKTDLSACVIKIDGNHYVLRIKNIGNVDVREMHFSTDTDVSGIILTDDTWNLLLPMQEMELKFFVRDQSPRIMNLSISWNDTKSKCHNRTMRLNL